MRIPSTTGTIDNAERYHVPGGKTARDIAEQFQIDALGGIDNLLNRINPIGPRRCDLMPEGYSRP